MSIYLGAHPLYKIAVEACQSIASDQPTQPGHSMALVSIVFAAASIEAYFDELAAFALRSFADLQPCPSKIKTFANMSEQIESAVVLCC